MKPIETNRRVCSAIVAYYVALNARKMRNYCLVLGIGMLVGFMAMMLSDAWTAYGFMIVSVVVGTYLSCRDFEEFSAKETAVLSDAIIADVTTNVCRFYTELEMELFQSVEENKMFVPKDPRHWPSFLKKGRIAMVLAREAQERQSISNDDG